MAQALFLVITRSYLTPGDRYELYSRSRIRPCLAIPKELSMIRHRPFAAAVAVFVALGLATAGPSAQAAQPPDLSGLHAFDLRVGKWKIHNRVLKERLAGSHDWLEYDGAQTWRSVMNGWGNADDTFLDKPGGAYSGVTLRAYGPKTGQWAIWWLDGRTPTARLDPPMLGRFTNG